MPKQEKLFDWQKPYHSKSRRLESYRQAVGEVAASIAADHLREADMAAYAEDMIYWLDRQFEDKDQTISLYGEEVRIDERIAELEGIALEAGHYASTLHRVLELMNEKLGVKWAPRAPNAFEGEKIYIEEWVEEGK